MGVVPSLAIIAICLLQRISCDDIIVNVTQGQLRGELLKTVTGESTYYSFKGIPYAKPPIGSLRFKAPQAPEPWEGVRNATAHGPVCPQVDLLNNIYVPGSEDCLFLNVYTPTLTPETPLPVMFFIHGGGFKFGSGNDDIYGPDFLVTEVVLVTINYRLDTLGFLCLGTQDVPGNAGMRDQVLALKWVNENIANFGGNPSNITIFGESAGASAVGYHLVSPMSKGLFQRAILESGVPSMDPFIPYKPVDRAFRLGKTLNITTNNANELLLALQEQPVNVLLNRTSFIFASEEITHIVFKFTPFTPVIEEDYGQEIFVSEDPFDTLDRGDVNAVDVMFSYNTYETLIMLPYYVNDTYQYINRYNTYNEMFVPSKVLIKKETDVIYDLGKMIVDYYFGNKTISVDNMPEFISYSSFASLVYDVHRFIRRWPQVGNVYLFKFESYSSRNYYGLPGAAYGLYGSSHFDDLFYLFDPKLLNLPLVVDSREYALVKQITTIFTNFAKYGNPTPDTSLGVTWPQFDTTKLAYVSVADNLTVGYAPDEDHIQFWKRILEYAGIKF